MLNLILVKIEFSPLSPVTGPVTASDSGDSVTEQIDFLSLSGNISGNLPEVGPGSEEFPGAGVVPIYAGIQVDTIAVGANARILLCTCALKGWRAMEKKNRWNGWDVKNFNVSLYPSQMQMGETRGAIDTCLYHHKHNHNSCTAKFIAQQAWSPLGGSAKQKVRVRVNVDVEKCGEAPTVTSQLHEKQKHESATDKLSLTHKLSELFHKKVVSVHARSWCKNAGFHIMM